MKSTLLITFLIGLSFNLTEAQAKKRLLDKPKIDDEKPYNDDWEARPSFPGGLKQFYKYLEKNIHYPTIAVKNKTQGKVHLNFTIEKDGSIDKITVVRGVSKEINAEAIRVLKNSPKWIPGTHHNRPIPFNYSIPVNFQLPTKRK